MSTDTINLVLKFFILIMISISMINVIFALQEMNIYPNFSKLILSNDLRIQINLDL